MSEMISEKEIIERLTRIEEGVKNLNDASKAAYTALEKSAKNELRIAHVEQRVDARVRVEVALSVALFGSILSFVAAFILKLF